MNFPAYSKYRIYITERILKNAGYFQLSGVSAYTSDDFTGDDVFLSGIASASSEYPGFQASNVNNGNPNDRWSSELSTIGPEWIAITLTSPVVIRSIFIQAKGAGGDGPGIFEVQGYNEADEKWEEIASYYHVATEQDMGIGANLELFNSFLSGAATVKAGGPASTVRIYDWLSGHLIKSAVIKDNGEWIARMPRADQQVMIVITGQAGTRPQAHGPSLPESFTL